MQILSLLLHSPDYMELVSRHLLFHQGGRSWAYAWLFQSSFYLVIPVFHLTDFLSYSLLMSPSNPFSRSASFRDPERQEPVC